MVKEEASNPAKAAARERPGAVGAPLAGVNRYSQYRL
jgi:hypothetical protein